MKTRQAWIEKGYEHFGLYGPGMLSIKKIAKDLSIARTSFNYHFKSKDEFIDDLLSHHRELHSQFIEAGKMHCKKYVPDLHQLLLAFPVGLKFHKQLFNHSQISKYQEVYEKVREISAKEFIIRLFIDYYKLPLNFEDASQLHESLENTWYSRLDINDLSLEKLVDSTEEIMRTLQVLMDNIDNRT